MEEAVNIYLGLPQFMWEGIFSIIVTLGAGLIIDFCYNLLFEKEKWR